MGETRGRRRTAFYQMHVRGPLVIDGPLTHGGVTRAPKRECMLTLYQYDDAAPEVTEHINTIGSPIVATREAAGYYRLTFPGTPFARPVIALTNGRGPAEQVIARLGSIESILVQSFDNLTPADNIIGDTPLCIFVFE